MNQWSRREFMKTAGAGIASTGPFVMMNARGRAAPSEQVRHAVIGAGGMGGTHCRTVFDLRRDCKLVAICDVDPEQRIRAAKSLADPYGIELHEDYRRILDDPTIDTISITTPDHWHTPIAIAAILAGKHVYVEKPCCHTVHEGRLLVEAAEKHGKCVQHGTQSRSGDGVPEAMKFLHEGGLGKVRMAKAINHQLRERIGRAEEESPPEGVNYDLWLGPAPEHKFTRNRWHYNWHWFWDYGSGDLGNDGIHQVDVARWGLGVGFPNAVTASGGQLFYDDDHETPDTQVVTYEYDDCYLQYEMRLWTNYKLEGHDNGTVFYGDRGKLEVGRRGCELTLIGEPTRKIGGTKDLDAHMSNFIDAVKADDPSILHAPIQEGFASATLCHLGNIATRVGRKIHYDSTKHTIPGDEQAAALLSREYRKGYELPSIG